MNLTTEILKDDGYVFLSERKRVIPHYKIAERQKREEKVKATPVRKKEKIVAPPKKPEREQMFLENNKCHYCIHEMILEKRSMKTPIKGDSATIEHKIPISRGGSNSRDNKVLACYNCNADKGWLTDEEYFAVLAVRKKYEKGYL